MSEEDGAAEAQQFVGLPEYEGPPAGVMGTGLALRATPLFVFLHVPKTAGTSARQMFVWMFGDFYFAFDPATHLANPHGQAVWEVPGFFDRYLMIGGHLGFRYPITAAARRTGRRVIFFSIMRDPVARVVSFYDFVRRRPAHPLHAALKSRTLLRAIEEVPGDEHWNCAQLKQIFGSARPELIERALAGDSFVIGRQEELPAFFDAVTAVSGIPRMATIPRENSLDNLRGPAMQPAREQPDFQRAVELIRDRNREEIAFMEKRLGKVLITTAERMKLF